MIELAAFLGNPGPEYHQNRHIAGWLLAWRLPFFDSLRWRKKFKGLWADIEGDKLLPFVCSPGGEAPIPPGPSAEGALATEGSPPDKIHFLMPGTYMNRSGDSIREAVSFFKIKSEQIIVIHDELELPLGTISLKFSGGLGGHNGLRSMKDNFGTPDFWRLRLGIGRPDDRLPGQGGKEGSGQGIVDWVLSNFSPEETSVLEPVLQTAGDLLIKILISGPKQFLPLWSKKKVI
jgi:PTH1 family peptidyl-tRNA hydrolase